MYAPSVEALVASGYEADYVTSLNEVVLPERSLLITHTWLNESEHDLVQRCGVELLGGRMWPRPDTLDLAEFCDLPVVQWTRANIDRDAAEGLFDRWQTDFILVKKSWTWRGRGVELVARKPNRFTCFREWMFDPNNVFMNVTKESATVYKFEVFNGHVTLAWTTGPRYVLRGYREWRHLDDERPKDRSLVGVNADLGAQLRELSARLTQRKVGYASVDMMKHENRLQVIEVNTTMTATDWSANQLGCREKLAEAVAAYANERSRFLRL